MFAIVLGTRPEIIKMTPVIRACQEKEVDFFVIHTGQHSSY
jgi:UDP-N-acetylglucosamine 2-epimerase (non-hydrolysing)